MTKEDGKKGEPKVYTATQVKSASTLPAVVEARAQDRKDFTWNFGPVAVSSFEQSHFLF